jgi:hypothetical protein
MYAPFACTSLCVPHDPLKHSCEQKYVGVSPSCPQVGHRIAAGFPQAEHLNEDVVVEDMMRGLLSRRRTTIMTR